MEKAAIANAPIYIQGSRFDVLIKHIVGLEGGYNDIKADRGGATKYGISLRFLKDEGKIDANHDGFKDFDLDFDGDIDGRDIRLLTPVMAKNLYFTCFWQRLKLDRLPFPIDGAVLDQAINGGGAAAVKCLQRAINDLPVNFKLTVDGVLGNLTIDAANMAQSAFGRKLLDRYRVQVSNRYRAIVAADKTQKIFLNGWLRRASELGNV